MRLPRPFQRLGVRFDIARLQEEVNRLPPSAWVAHPNGIAGNSSVRLISIDGGENDDVNGRMAMTPHLQQSPYLRQILASFGVVWSRSRLMKLAPGATVPEHADINYHWFSRVRVHIPVLTWPQVRFYCGDEAVHMAAGEAWLFDNWRLHRVENPTAHERIHLVADTAGSASFWQFVLRSAAPDTQDFQLPYDPARTGVVITEQLALPPVMAPTEVEVLTGDLCAELTPLDVATSGSSVVTRYQGLLDAFCKDWRALYLHHGETEAGRGELLNIRDGLRSASRQLGRGLMARTNRVNAHTILEARVLRPMVASPGVLTRPVFIVAAPRSGSTLLFETLARHSGLQTLGGEAHWLIENIAALQVGAPGVDSNRLTATHFSPDVRAQILRMLAGKLIDAHGEPAALSPVTRLLEKTPKNALRVPFIDRLFPDAQFIFLWREPRGNLSSIIEAWRSGSWKTYNGLEGFAGPWSLLLPPEWQSMSGKPLEEIAAFQWAATNRLVMDDLAPLPLRRWTSVDYDELLANPTSTLERLCQFLDLDMDESLRARLARPLPHSAQTHTPPQPDKWRGNASLIERVLSDVAPVYRRLQTLRPVMTARTGTDGAR